MYLLLRFGVGCSCGRIRYMSASLFRAVAEGVSSVGVAGKRRGRNLAAP